MVVDMVVSFFIFISEIKKKKKEKKIIYLFFPAYSVYRKFTHKSRFVCLVCGCAKVPTMLLC